MRQLQFFIVPSFSTTGGLCPPDPLGFFALELIPAGARRATLRRPALPLIRLQSALRLRPRRALSSAEVAQDYHLQDTEQGGHFRSPVLLARPVLLTTPVRFCSHRDNQKTVSSGQAS